MSTLILLSYKVNIVTYKNSTNNCDSDRNNGTSSGSDNDNINKSYTAKMTCI